MWWVYAIRVVWAGTKLGCRVCLAIVRVTLSRDFHVIEGDSVNVTACLHIGGPRAESGPVKWWTPLMTETAWSSIETD